MLRDYIASHNEEGATHLAAYTRNPNVIKMMRRNAANKEVYPDTQIHELSSIALELPHACLVDDESATYHLGRYGDGLYGSNDPASSLLDGVPLQQRYPSLRNPGNALVVVSRIMDLKS